MQDLESLVIEILSGIEKIQPSPYLLLVYWQQRHADEAGKPITPPEHRDSYERADNYNQIGVAVYFELRFSNAFGSQQF